jgi:ppGpp synthetase/RelA/SpoT-type nucleotidyltranferase
LLGLVAARERAGRYYVSEASGGAFVVGQRLKRMATIRDKLEREPDMSLSRMHDLGGCRAVLPSQAAVDQVLGRLREQRRWELLPRTWDYVNIPKPDGIERSTSSPARTAC